ncbi:MAG TPA: VWA domain-containing protein [Acidimicrobiales bacterium]|nr:VWA domain-containing protein [Acidimicrobiales bacterium]
MTFLSGSRLLLLAAPLALLAAYLAVQRARRKLVVRFTSVEMLASVAPRRSGWQRHVPAAALLAALALLVVGFAQPARAIRTPRQRATVVLTLDVSGSMVAGDVAPSRLAAAQQAARGFVGALPPGIQLGLVSFASTASVLVPPTSDRTTVVAAIDSLRAAGGTATGDAIYLSLDAINALPVAAGGKKAPAAIVLMSDGTPTVGRAGGSPAATVAAATAAAKQAGVRVNTIAFGTPDGELALGGRTVAVPSDPAAMAQIASDSGGRTFTAKTAGQLKSVYGEIGRVVGYDVHRREITAWFTGIALAFGVLAAVTALIWTQRIV